ncbi:tRNA 5-methoxyuridine(34)/uridine 5-oxyacetic acid(34) synthase CmoB [Moraxella bovoculi]|uniref:tRNA 5-methoxyuridine(34)/uridine 5-oxyacetic acid(34) synthase CmoB n=1 Tax=Moraxella bovoculi TaxID=386891 RepID=UPI000A8B14DA|nr:tRNA 5-methoxyuridine(34)/uridine 5-oxyacetic acid(34) synthase CmoB [Moraxella bovoculi]
MNNTIFNAERALYMHLLQMSKYHLKAGEWIAAMPSWLAAIKDKRRYAHAPFYASAIERLPVVPAISTNLNDKVEAVLDWQMADFKKTQSLLINLKPWRKGPFFLSSDDENKSIHIDTEWRSDFKWERVRSHLDLQNKRILDVGGGSGYHGFRMLGDGAKSVIVIDPSCLFYHQFMAIKHFMGVDLPVHYIPVPLESLPSDSALFDVVFSMGVLYHRASPFEHFEQLKGQLQKGGTLVLETLVMDGDEHTVLVPDDRYAQMNNVYFLPSVPALTKWLTKAGFSDVRCVDVDVTSTDEQRATAWMDYQSLADFLDKNDPTKTVEGYPAPKRAVMIAKR